MPARDMYHDVVKAALINDGWIITHDPFRLEYGGKNAYIDLGAQRPTFALEFAAERGSQLIAVEIKTFAGPSVLNDLQQAIGQYQVYRSWMRLIEPERTMYLAVDSETAQNVFAQEFGRSVANDVQLQLIVVDLEQERVMAWKQYPDIDTSS